VFQPLAGVLGKFFADRGTHLAAMIAYFALLSFLPLTFIALALLALGGRPDESSYLVTELQTLFPASSVDQIVRAVDAVQRNWRTLGIVGGVTLAWSSLSFFSVLESAFNIVYGRPNRSFLHGKLLALVYMGSALVVLFVGLTVGGIGRLLLERHASGVIANAIVAWTISLLVSTLAAFAFCASAYHRLTNVRLSWREVVPGSLVAAIALQTTFQALPLFLRFTREVVALQALGTGALLLVWLYVMANVIVLGAEVNWWLARGRRREEDVAGLA
jgi:YihY family inner membrane protein